MGKRAQLKRQKQLEEVIKRKEIVQQVRRQRQPWIFFWRKAEFWIFVVSLILLISFPFLNPQIEKWRNPQKTPSASGQAVIHTVMGDIEIELYINDAPKTTENFRQLAKRGYYNNLTFHRIIKDFMIQGGDPKGDGTGGESAFGAPFEDEINARSLGLPEEQIKQLESQGYRFDGNLQSHKMEIGSVAMANSGPNTNGSQFFIVTEQAQPHLDGKHTVFGTVTKGTEVVRAIATVEVDENNKPKEAVYINSIEIK